jgi:hypothetical protein
MQNSFLWKHLTAIHELGSTSSDGSVPKSGFPLAAVLKLAENAHLLTSVRSIVLSHYSYMESRGERSEYMCDFIAAVAPKIESVRLYAPGTIVETFLANSNPHNIVRMDITAPPENFCDLAKKGFPRLRDLRIVAEESEEIVEFAYALGANSGNLRRLCIRSGAYGWQLHPATVRSLAISICAITKGNPNIERVEYEHGGSVSSAKSDLHFIGAEWEYDVADWRSYPSKLFTSLGIDMSKFYIAGNVMWWSFYCKGLADEFVQQGYDAAQFFWEACKLDDQDPQVRFSCISEAMLNTAESETLTDDEKTAFCRFLFSKMRAHSFSAAYGTRGLSTYGILLRGASLDDAERDEIIAEIKKIVSDSRVNPLLLFERIPRPRYSGLDGCVVSLGQCIHPETFSTLPEFENADAESAFVEHFLSNPERTTAIRKASGNDLRTFVLKPSGNHFVERLLFAMINSDYTPFCVDLAAQLLPVLESSDKKLDLTGLKQFCRHNLELLQDPEVFSLLCRVLDDYRPIVENLNSMLYVPIPAFFTLMKSVQKRRTGSDELPGEIVLKVVENAWKELLTSYSPTDSVAALAGEILDVCQVIPPEPARMLRSQAINSALESRRAIIIEEIVRRNISY